MEEVVKWSNVEAPTPKKKLQPLCPQGLRKQHEDECFSKFLCLLKYVHINLLLVEILQGISKYAKYAKGIVARKKRLMVYETVAFSKECKSTIQNRHHKKLKDSCSFIVQINLGTMLKPRSYVITVKE